MASTELSVIIPVYNASGTIERCVNSILNQSFQNFELILVNDCSKDNTLEVIQNYSENHGFIHVLNLTINKGVANARNEGMGMAKGKYVTFIDADDFVHPDYFNSAMENHENFDLLITGLDVGNLDNFETHLPKPISAEDSLGIRDAYEMLSSNKQLMWGPYNKFYLKELLLKHRIFFENYFGEDTIFVLKYFYGINSIKCIDYSGYFYIRDQTVKTISRGSDRPFKSLDKFLSTKVEVLNKINGKFNMAPIDMEDFSDKHLLIYLARFFAVYSKKYKIDRGHRKVLVKKLRSEKWTELYAKSNFNRKYNLLKPLILKLPVGIADFFLVILFNQVYRTK
ncbi:glycosyltransferase family 2 protein [Maribacter polysaccharolyticus]|uniref:glycosyltransferase family 2 protein n=1 Tax=Maribacter polysaccharolyticus TaxID=3020831 RepID=UPI00237F4786|nr:glycosyltransferase family 2 protein [Maribacter polysaccharolyticus]MDE3741488.1 glycosyltransferase family 2 protein [Maribacter polysaccharolyticus]